MKVAALPWVGGKSVQGATGPWVCSLLPWLKQSVYVEPCGGMAGVMLQRLPVLVEIYNDLDGNAVNWFRQAREQPEELIRLLELTPHAREEYDSALRSLAEGVDCPLESARCWTVAVWQSMVHAPPPAHPGWGIRYTARSMAGVKDGYWRDKISAIAARMRNVQIENRTAEELLKRTASVSEAVIYVDPPYPTASDFYGRIDTDLLADLLLAQEGLVAVSGYGEEWDGLGWHRHECPSVHGGRKTARIWSADQRREILWTNYDPAEHITGQQALML